MKAVIWMTLLVASPAAAAPTYLQCNFPGNSAILMVTADEANSAVTVSLPSTGHTEKMPAAFTASELRFQNNMLSYVISRTDLAINRTIKMIKSTDTGQCKVETAPKRAF